MQKIKLVLSILLMSLFSQNSMALDAAANGGWMSIGVPNYLHMGTQRDGTFHLNGDDFGSCGGVKPSYLRVNANDEHFKEFYSWLLVMTVTKLPLDCMVASGCGTNQVWASYCRGPLQ